MQQVAINTARALLEIGAVQFNPAAPVRFKSGILSPVYVDNRRLPYAPQHWRTIIDGFQQLVKEKGVIFDVIAGIETAGIPHSAAFGYAANIPSVFVRKAPKEHGLKRRVEGGVVADLRVLLIEDLVTTGGSSLSGVQALRDEQAIVNDCLAIVSYGFTESAQAFDAAQTALHTLTSFPVILDVAAQDGRIDDATAASVQTWLADPHTWQMS